MKYIFIFLNDKLITCDTILPFVVDIKKKYPKLNIKFYTFNAETYDFINKNTNLMNIIKSNATINIIGWYKTYNNKILRKIFKLIHLLHIAALIILFNCKNIHFKGLERFPFNLLYFFNKKKTFLFESNCWGFSLDVIKADKIFYKNREVGEEKECKAYNYLLAFSRDWPQLNYCKKNNKTSYLIPSTRTSKNWIKICKNQAQMLSKEKPLWMNKKNKFKKKIIYVLGYLGKFPTVAKDCTGETLLLNTLNLILENTDHIILLKPHAVTDITKLQLLIKKLKTERIYITYNHVAVLSNYCDYALANYFSYALTDAWVQGLKVIEYTKYDDKVLNITKNKSLVSKYVDVFINDKPKILIEELNKNYIRIKRIYSSKYNKNYSEILELISG